MNTTTAYTPLESLLLFQSLAAYGTDPNVFARISDLLKNNILVRDAETFDPGRLSPDALRELYLQLLREELRSESVLSDENEDAIATKKRKLQSPPLPNLKDGSDYTEKLPQLVDRLYARYRDYMVRLIREDERRYEILEREIAEIERGEWDERISKEERMKNNKTVSGVVDETKSTKSTSRSHTPAQTGVTTPQTVKQADIRSYTVPKDAPPPPSSNQGSSPLPPQVEPKAEVPGASEHQKPTAPTTPAIPDQVEASRVNNQQLPPAAQPKPPSTERPPLPPQLQVPQPPNNWQYPPGHPGPQPPYPNQNYQQFPQQYPPYQGPPRGTFPAHGPPGPIPSPSNSMGQAVPIPQTMGAGSPSRPLDALADMAEQQYRAPSASPMVSQGPSPGPGYAAPYSPYPPPVRNDGRSPPNAVPAQWNQQFMPQYPPAGYNFSPQAQGQLPFPLRPDIAPPQPRQYTSPYNSNQYPPATGKPSAVSTPKPPSLSIPNTPASTGRPRHSTGRATQWTPNPTASTPKAPRSPTRPEMEPLSPILAPAKLPGIKSSRESTSAPKVRGRTQRGSQRTRAASNASSAVARSRRSQSVMSHADELSLDTEVGGLRKVKQESSTPRPVEETGDTTADEGIGRRRHGATKEAASPRRPPKRKRQESPEREPSGPPTEVVWTRNFPKISVSALERVGAHRSAGIFAHPIKERDAPGYKSIILQPQDLKSIRSAISAGNKAGAAIVANMEDNGEQNVTLPISEDLVPPKGIVNNAQLEKELMHIFANAIMFNPDPDRGLGQSFEVIQSVEENTGGATENYDFDENGVVKDTKAMFADVEKIVEEMRSAERRSEEARGEPEDDEMDELAGDVDHGGSVAKRRRRA